MILAGIGGSVPCFENDVTMAVPDVAWKAVVPRPDATRTHGVSEPLLDKVAAVEQVARTQGGAGPAATGHPGEPWCVLVVGTPDVPTEVGYLGQVDAVRRRFDLARLGVVTLKCRASHHASGAVSASWRVTDAQNGGTLGPLLASCPAPRSTATIMQRIKKCRPGLEVWLLASSPSPTASWRGPAATR